VLTKPWLRRVEVSRLWCEREKDHKFFSNLCIAHDGGFTEVHILFTNDRLFWGAVAIMSLALNLYFLFWPNVDILIESDVWHDKTGGILFFNNVVLGKMDKELYPKVFIAIFELFLLVWLFFQAGLHIGIALFFRKTDKAQSWHRIAHFFFDSVPELTTLSSMRLLYFVTPSVLAPGIYTKVKRSLRHNSCFFRVFPVLRFVMVRAVMGLIGFDAFLVKFREAAVYTTGDKPWAQSWFACLAFLNQVLGVVNVARFARWRLLLYIFGGEDGYVSRRDLARQQVWHAMLVMKLWEASREFKAPLVWFLSAVLSYSDSDFQMLTLNESNRVCEAALALPQEEP